MTNYVVQFIRYLNLYLDSVPKSSVVTNLHTMAYRVNRAD